MDQNSFINEISKIFSNIPKNFFKQIEKYKTFLIEENQSHNLTNLAEENKIYSEYFYNSIIPYSNFNFEKLIDVVDVGSGSGIPGILIKLMFPKVNLTIVEANSKKCNFLKKLIEILNLNNIKIINERIETFSLQNLNKYDFVTSRAVAELKILIEVCFPIIKLNGIFHTVKSTKIDDEIKRCNFIFSVYKINDFQKQFISTINLTTYNFIIVKKNLTPEGYPRQWKEIIK